MSDAPEKIWAWKEITDDTIVAKFWVCSRKRVDCFETEYILADVALAQVAAAHQKLIEIRPIMPEGTKTQDYVEGFEAAEADYHRQIADAFPLDAQAALDAMLAQARRQECERVLALTLEAVGYTEDILSPQALNTIRGERTDD